MLQCLRQLPGRRGAGDRRLSAAARRGRHAPPGPRPGEGRGKRQGPTDRARRGRSGGQPVRVGHPFHLSAGAGLGVTPQLVLSSEDYWACPDLVDSRAAHRDRVRVLRMARQSTGVPQGRASLHAAERRRVDGPALHLGRRHAPPRLGARGPGLVRLSPDGAFIAPPGVGVRSIDAREALRTGAPRTRTLSVALLSGRFFDPAMIVARVRRTIVERALIDPRMRVLAACSGGPDSAAMLVALARLREELGFTLEAASVDHGLRPAAAADVETARAAGERARCAVPRAARRAWRAGARCRRARARRATPRSHELAARLGAQRIAVGHTQDDQAETVLHAHVARRGRRRARGHRAAARRRRDPAADRLPARRCGRVRGARTARASRATPAMTDPRFQRVRVRTRAAAVTRRARIPRSRSISRTSPTTRARLKQRCTARAQALLERSPTSVTEVIDAFDAGPRRRARFAALALRAWLARATGARARARSRSIATRARGCRRTPRFGYRGRLGRSTATRRR